EPLGGLPGRLLADGDIELAVLAEMERTALMAGRYHATEPALVVPAQQYDLTPGHGHVAPRRESTDAMVWKRLTCDIRYVNVSIRRKRWVERHADQPAPPVVVDREREKCFRHQSTILDAPKRAGLLADEHAAVGRDGQPRGRGHPPSDFDRL